VLTGYRHYDATGIAPLFPFGYGLSYTRFRYDHLAVRPSGDHAVVEFDVTNGGPRAGVETPQVYVGAPPDNSLHEPVKWLRAFSKVSLPPVQTQHVSLTLTARDISYWDPSHHRWAVQPGCHPVLVGASATDIRLRGPSVGDGSSCTVRLTGLLQPSALLPASTRCASRRRFVIYLPRGLRSARVYVNGRRVRVLRGRRLHARVDLGGRPRGRFTVRIVARTRAGRRVVQVRHYRSCTRRRLRPRPRR
jgi:hypothetical protein